MKIIIQIIIVFVFLIIIFSVIYSVSRFDNSGLNFNKLKSSLSDIPIHDLLNFSGEGGVNGVSLRGRYKSYYFNGDKKDEIVNFYLENAKKNRWELKQKNLRSGSMIFCENGIAYNFDFSVYEKLMIGVYWTSNRNSPNYCRESGH